MSVVRCASEYTYRPKPDRAIQTVTS